jgi:hypothetical protein
MHKKTKGSIAELAVAAKLLEEGWRILMPYGENARYDLVAERNGRFVRIQVKYTTPKAGVMKVNCRSSNNWSILQYTADEIDVIAAYNPLTRDVFYVPSTEFRKGDMKLRLDPPKNNQRAKVRFASQFRELRDGEGKYEVGSSRSLKDALKIWAGT